MSPSLLRWLLPAYLVVFLIAAFLGRAWVVWRREGVNPLAFGFGDSAHDLIGRLFAGTFGVAAGVVGIYSLFPPAYRWLAPIAWLEHPAVNATGVALLICALPWMVIAQTQMGSSWRVGIDTATAPELVGHGLFKVSRNPIFLGLQWVLVGLLLTLPNAVSLAACSVGIALVQVQVRLEEEHLERTHGDAYRAYRRQVRRWL